MDPVAVLLVALALAVALAVVLSPLRAGHVEAATAADEAVIADLQAAKEAKYLEIREAEMDYRTGKLSQADWRLIDRQLRAEAVEVLRRLDALGAGVERAEADSGDNPPAEPLPSPEPCSRPSSPSSRSGSASS